MTPSEYRSLPVKKASKYKNEYWIVDNIRFQSKREARRYGQLKMLERAGEITDLRRQVKYDLVVKEMKVCRYVADFVYRQNGKIVVNDVKGMRTPEYRLKKKLMLAIFGITILET